MQDKETDSYWSIMKETALSGPASGSRLDLLPGSEKTTWGTWMDKHPDTLILTYQGREHVPYDPYANYFSSRSGFNGIRASDTRLPDKTMVFTFRRDGIPYAIPHMSFSGGGIVKLPGGTHFLYRRKGDSVFQSTTVIGIPIGATVKLENEDWLLRTGDRNYTFDPGTRSFRGAEETLGTALEGFDTFWYVWSLTNDSTELLSAEKLR
jgi:hypothetical protein